MVRWSWGHRGNGIWGAPSALGFFRAPEWLVGAAAGRAVGGRAKRRGHTSRARARRLNMRLVSRFLGE
jgi:hypothetical protein